MQRGAGGTNSPSASKMDTAAAIERLKRQKEALTSVAGANLSSPQFVKWRRDTELAIEHVFGSESRHLPDFRSIRYRPIGYSVVNPEPAFAKAFRGGVQRAHAVLDSMIQEVEEYGLPTEIRESENASNKVFVVHGHNEVARETVARFLERLGLDPVILHKLPNKGRFVLEKFTDYADVAAAVVLLTADDRGGPASLPRKNQKMRARQNVILELGFFLGRLGQPQVCALYEDGVEIPSDYQGVLFVPFDPAGAWKMLLARELKEIGLPIDMNNAL